ncbi:intraflagellar transport protein [Raphidocelis subcapitata]|uniref:Intraflagellar transport protein n=1 Tax=Raphidocelis subcapitata TaxID=307507 RepID=A0A2V0NU35_9CHLO|nr:intraflagellar transport protein [Raphidocelis subcapitata]|eukprot:GBF89063.1 intraflagellar transport protein [Raphidocelis subcapitata]
MVGPRRAAQAQAQAEAEQVCISAKESFELVRCLLRVSIYHVSFLRGLFPDTMFSPATMNNLGGVTVQMLGGEGVALSPDAQQLKDWVEKGVVDAVRERFLKKLYFGIAADPDCTSILEEVVFTFSYGGDETTMRLDAAAGGVARASINNLGNKAAGQGKMISIKHVKNQIFRLMRTLVELCGTLEEVPEKRHIFMRLTYQDDVPEGYEPPHFAPATEDQANAAFTAQPFSMKAGSLSTEHHRVSVRVKSLLDAVEDCGAGGGGPTPIDEDEPATGGGGGGGGGGDAGPAPSGAHGAGGVPGGGDGAVKGDEGDEGGAGIDWSAGGGAGGAAQARAAAPPAEPRRGIRREEAQTPATAAAAAAGGFGRYDASGMGPSQEVDGPAGSDGNYRASPSAAPHAAQPPPPMQEAGDAYMADAPQPDAEGAGLDGAAAFPGAVRASEDEVLQLTLAPLSLGPGGAGTDPPGSAPGSHSQLASSQQTAAAVEAVRAHVLARLARAGYVDRMDLAAKFCNVSLAALDQICEALVAEGTLVQVDAERFAHAGRGDSGDSPRTGTRGRGRGRGRGGGGARGGAGPEGAPAAQARAQAAAAAPAAAAARGKRGALEHGDGSGAFDPDAAGGLQHVFDSSQHSRLGAAGAKRKKTSFVAAPIAQGGIPGDGRGSCLPGGDSAATTTPNGSGTHAARGRLSAMRRR